MHAHTELLPIQYCCNSRTEVRVHLQYYIIDNNVNSVCFSISGQALLGKESSLCCMVKQVVVGKPATVLSSACFCILLLSRYL